MHFSNMMHSPQVGPFVVAAYLDRDVIKSDQAGRAALRRTPKACGGWL